MLQNLTNIAQTISDFSTGAEFDTLSTATSTTSSGSAAGGVILAVLFIFYAIIFLLVAIPAIIVNWKLFTKAGRPGWASIIPVYNTYVMNEIGGGPVWYFILAIVPGVNIVGIILILAELSKKYSKPATVWLAAFFPLIALFMIGKTDYIGGNTAPQTPQAPASQPPAQPPQAQPPLVQ